MGYCLEDTKRYIALEKILRTKQKFVLSNVKYVYQGNCKHWNVQSEI